MKKLMLEWTTAEREYDDYGNMYITFTMVDDEDNDCGIAKIWVSDMAFTDIAGINEIELGKDFEIKGV